MEIQAIENNLRRWNWGEKKNLRENCFVNITSSHKSLKSQKNFPSRIERRLASESSLGLKSIFCFKFFIAHFVNSLVGSSSPHTQWTHGIVILQKISRISFRFPPDKCAVWLKNGLQFLISPRNHTDRGGKSGGEAVGNCTFDTLCSGTRRHTQTMRYETTRRNMFTDEK